MIEGYSGAWESAQKTKLVKRANAGLKELALGGKKEARLHPAIVRHSWHTAAYAGLLVVTAGIDVSLSSVIAGSLLHDGAKVESGPLWFLPRKLSPLEDELKRAHAVQSVRYANMIWALDPTITDTALANEIIVEMHRQFNDPANRYPTDEEKAHLIDEGAIDAGSSEAAVIACRLAAWADVTEAVVSPMDPSRAYRWERFHDEGTKLDGYEAAAHIIGTELLSLSCMTPHEAVGLIRQNEGYLSHIATPDWLPDAA